MEIILHAHHAEVSDSLREQAEAAIRRIAIRIGRVANAIIRFVGELREKFQNIEASKPKDQSPSDESAGPPSLEALQHRIVGVRSPKKDAEWNMRNANAGAQWLSATLMPWLATLPAGTPLNMLDAMAHPDGLLGAITNLAEVGPALLAHVRDAASVLPALAPRAEALAAQLQARLGAAHIHHGGQRIASPVLTTRFATAHGELAFFSMFTTFGTPQDITLASLRVEHLFAVDAFTKAVLKRNVLNASVDA